MIEMSLLAGIMAKEADDLVRMLAFLWL